MKILILCTGNSCRSQMAEGFLKSFDPRIEVWSAGTEPSGRVHPLAVAVMKEKGIDLSAAYPKTVDLFLGQAFDFVITVCGGANESCPAFTGKVGQRLHIGFDDPAEATGTEEEVMAVFRRVRDEIEAGFGSFYEKTLKPFLLKETVREKYAGIATQPADTGCCGGGSCCGSGSYTVFSESYNHLDGYVPEADLQLGCGIPTAFAGIREGDTVADLGSGAGNDCFVARELTGATGRVIGIDFTDAMVEKARANAIATGYQNVEFIKGDIEKIPLPDGTADVVISNCVLNLVPDKNRAFMEIRRILKPGGHFCISDVVTLGDVPEKIRNDAEMYAGCVAGAPDREVYLDIIRRAGFTGIHIPSEKNIPLPHALLAGILDETETKQYHAGSFGLKSITITATKL